MPSMEKSIPFRHVTHHTFPQFGREVRATRLKMGLTQAKLAALAGVGLRTIYNLEHGKQIQIAEKMMTVLDVLRITMVFRA